MRTAAFAILACLGMLVPMGVAHAAEPSVTEILKTVDERLRHSGDYHATVQLREKFRDGSESAMELHVYRRDQTEQLMMLFTQPKSRQGKGYLRLERNLWEYDPSVGRWERRTKRVKIGGTNTYEQDYDQWNFSKDYDAVDAGFEAVGKTRCRKIKLTAKKGTDLSFSALMLWVDDSRNVIKRETFGSTGKSLRVDYMPKYAKVHNPWRKSDMYYPSEIVEYDEEQGTTAVLRITAIDLKPLDANMFTKAWLESRSR